MQALDCKVNILEQMPAKAATLTSHTKVKFIHKIRILCPRPIPEPHLVYFMVNKKETFSRRETGG
jgi:hypothetical protein